jgi:hypothetical protein
LEYSRGIFRADGWEVFDFGELPDACDNPREELDGQAAVGPGPKPVSYVQNLIVVPVDGAERREVGG